MVARARDYQRDADNRWYPRVKRVRMRARAHLNCGPCLRIPSQCPNGTGESSVQTPPTSEPDSIRGNRWPLLTAIAAWVPPDADGSPAGFPPADPGVALGIFGARSGPGRGGGGGARSGGRPGRPVGPGALRVRPRAGKRGGDAGRAGQGRRAHAAEAGGVSLAPMSLLLCVYLGL